MTILEFEEVISHDEKPAPPADLTVKCSWCGEIIHLHGNDLALAMCQTCFQRMLEEFLRTQQSKAPTKEATVS